MVATGNLANENILHKTAPNKQHEMNEASVTLQIQTPRQHFLFTPFHLNYDFHLL